MSSSGVAQVLNEIEKTPCYGWGFWGVNLAPRTRRVSQLLLRIAPQKRTRSCRIIIHDRLE